MYFFSFCSPWDSLFFLRWVNRCTPKQSSRSQERGETISCHGISPVCMVYWRSFLCMRVPRTLSWYIAQFCLISWLVANTRDKRECLSCSLDAAWPSFACMQYFISASHISDAIHHLKYLICNLEQITSYGWLVLTTIFRWLILTGFDSNDCKQILPGGERVIHRCSLEDFFFFGYY